MICSGLDSTRNSGLMPASSAASRNTRSPNAWKVLIHVSAYPYGMSWSTRSAISAAAFSVKVRARISSGLARLLAMRCAMRRVSTVVLPVPAPAMVSSGPAPWSTAARWASERCSRMRSAADGSERDSTLTPRVSHPPPRGRDRLTHEEALDRLEQIGRRARLAQVRVDADAARAVLVVRHRVRGERHDRNVARLRIRLQVAG